MQSIDNSNRRYRIGIDVGGTFTDLQVLDQETGSIGEFKTSTTPQDPAIGILDGIVGASKRFGFSISDIDMIVHGTTIATNAVLEDKLHPIALITTIGFEDILEIARHSRKDVYGLYAERRRLLVPRQRRFGVVERMTARGTVETKLDLESLKSVAAKIDAMGITAVAVCLLNAYANDQHERQIGEWLAENYPHFMVSISTTLSPEIREYERTSTTVLNASLTPIVSNYMHKLQGRMQRAGVDASVLILQSNGGASLPEHAALEPARLLLSGPCGGTIAAERVSSLLGEPNLLAVDMGGTSFDISIIQDGRTTRVAEGEVDGCPVRLPMAEISTIGAGGGSIAWVDEAGRLRVGPQSAGSAPGPACYGRGATQATVTDANIVLGRMDAGGFMNGTMPLDRDAAVNALRNTICVPLGLGIEEAAEGVIAIAASHMANAIRLCLFSRGLDPDDFALVSFGGAGGLHAAAVAEEIGVGRIIYPRGASTLSAFGMLWTDIVHDFARTRIVAATEDSIAAIGETIRAMSVSARAALKRDGIPEANWSFDVALDLRYKGQGYELSIPIGAPTLDADALDRTVAAFHAAHEQRFSHSDTGAPVEIVTVRISARGLLPMAGTQEYQAGPPTTTLNRKVYVGGAWRDVPVLRRDAVGAGVAGPLIVEEEYTTILVPGGWEIRLRPDGELVAEKSGCPVQ